CRARVRRANSASSLDFVTPGRSPAQLLLTRRICCCRTNPGGDAPGMDLHPFRQRTLKQRAALSGVGLHSGASVALTLAPAPVDSGIVFVRDGVEIPALSEFVVDTTLNTSLGRGRVRIGTVEHLLAALAGCGIDNALIEVEGPEVPIADGSSEPFVALVREAGVHEQRATRRFLLVRKAVSVSEGDKLARLSPSRGRLVVDYTIDFCHPLISDQCFRLEMTEKSFQKEIARDRTFGFKRDVERLHSACEVVQPRAADELHALQESLIPVLALEEQVA